MTNTPVFATFEAFSPFGVFRRFSLVFRPKMRTPVVPVVLRLVLEVHRWGSKKGRFDFTVDGNY